MGFELRIQKPRHISEIEELSPFLFTEEEGKKWEVKERKFTFKLFFLLDSCCWDCKSRELIGKKAEIIKKMYGILGFYDHHLEYTIIHPKWESRNLITELNFIKKDDVYESISIYDAITNRQEKSYLRMIDVFNYSIVLTHRVLARENEKLKMTLLLIRHLCPESVLSVGNLPLDLFKIIFHSVVHVDIYKYWRKKIGSYDFSLKVNCGNITPILTEL